MLLGCCVWHPVGGEHLTKPIHISLYALLGTFHFVFFVKSCPWPRSLRRYEKAGDVLVKFVERGATLQNYGLSWRRWHSTMTAWSERTPNSSDRICLLVRLAAMHCANAVRASKCLLGQTPSRLQFNRYGHELIQQSVRFKPNMFR